MNEQSLQRTEVQESFFFEQEDRVVWLNKKDIKAKLGLQEYMALLLSYSGALRVKEVHNLKINNVMFDDERKECEIDIVEMQNCVDRSFLMTEENSYNLLKLHHDMLSSDKLEDDTEPYFHPAYHNTFVKKVTANIELPLIIPSGDRQQQLLTFMETH